HEERQVLAEDDLDLRDGRGQQGLEGAGAVLLGQRPHREERDHDEHPQIEEDALTEEEGERRVRQRAHVVLLVGEDLGERVEAHAVEEQPDREGHVGHRRDEEREGLALRDGPDGGHFSSSGSSGSASSSPSSAPSPSSAASAACSSSAASAASASSSVV